MADKTGAILVMSHIGNWELAAQKLNSKGLPIMLYLGAKHKEQVEGIQKEKLAQTGIKIVATNETEKSPFALLPGINFLREGGIVSMTGDRLWGEQSYVTVDFLGYEVTPAGHAAFVCPDDRCAANDFFCASGFRRNLPYKSIQGTEGCSPPHAQIEKRRCGNRYGFMPTISSVLLANIPSSGIILNRFSVK